MPAPWAETPADVFRGQTVVELRSIDRGAEIRWTERDDVDLAADPGAGNLYTGPIPIETMTELRFMAREAGFTSRVMTAAFHAIDKDWRVRIFATPNAQYTGGGPDGLIDGLRGPENWRTGRWHGYQGQDLVATLDLGKSVRILSAGAGFLQDMRSWILMPGELVVETSADGASYREAGRVSHEVSDREDGIVRRDLTVALDGGPVRFIRFRATNYGPLPAWHPGAGGESFIFIDELIVKSGQGESN